MAAAAERTKGDIGPGVTCPSFRQHPAIIAQAAATMAAMYPGRFWLGLGSGEALNEHVVADYWPEVPERIDRMFEAVEIFRKLFTGKDVKHRGPYYRMETMRLWTMPAEPPPIYVATAGPVTAEKTGRLCDGLITVGAPEEKIEGIFERFEKGAREAGKDPATLPKILQLHLSWAATDEQAMTNAMTEWPNGGMKFPKADIRSPHFVRPRQAPPGDPEVPEPGLHQGVPPQRGPESDRVDRGLRPRGLAEAESPAPGHHRDPLSRESVERR
jgi:G6PDH family F420-dependent oxidoreductase